MRVQDILDRVTVLYNDVDYIRVSQGMYFKFLDDAIHQIILVRPDANVKTSVVTLTPGTRQSIPDDGLSLIDIYMNRDEVDNPGTPVLQVMRKDLDRFSNWHISSPEQVTEITEYAYDLRSPRTFWVNPYVPTDPPIKVEMDYSYNAPNFADVIDAPENIMNMTIPLDDRFTNAIVEWMLHLLYSVDSSSDVDRQLAAQYEQSFYSNLGVEYSSAKSVAPMNTAVAQETARG